MSKLKISFSNLKRIGAMSLALMTLSGCSNAVANQNKIDSDFAGSSYSDELLDEFNHTEIGVIDEETKINIVGAALEIRDENGFLVDEFVTTGEIIFINLKPGNYTLIEVKAPDGYEMPSSNEIRFKAGSRSALITNKKQKVKTK